MTSLIHPTLDFFKHMKLKEEQGMTGTKNRFKDKEYACHSRFRQFNT